MQKIVYEYGCTILKHFELPLKHSFQQLEIRTTIFA